MQLSINHRLLKFKLKYDQNAIIFLFLQKTCEFADRKNNILHSLHSINHLNFLQNTIFNNKA